jgi:malonyl CoA-acyl carrier protein transacylase
MAGAGVDTFVHVGPGDVTAGLVKRTVPDATVHVVSNLDEVHAVGQQLSVQ